jgi:Ser/Thr protein kinase RdoA (MazF antagonist)
MPRLSLFEEISAVKSICQQIGFGQVMPTLLKAAHHTSLLIASHRIVARVQSGEPIATASECAGREIVVTRYLADRGAPTLAPIPGFAVPYVRAPTVVTFWPYADQRRAASEADASVAAMSLTTVHQALRDFDGKLPPYTETLDRCWDTLLGDHLSAALPATDKHLLKTEFRRLRHLVEAIDGRWVALHGDSHLGNLLLDNDGRNPLWMDFEHTCLGPREYDIANLPVEAWPMFPNANPELVAAFALLKSVCVVVWCLADSGRSREMQEAADYHLSVVRGLAR